MCIALLTTAHPRYPFILIDNRDEFLSRPTADADWWAAPNSHVLGGRDLQKSEQGTWLGITRQGKIAVLTNFREEGVTQDKAKSRGGIVNSFLTRSPSSQETSEQFVARLIQETGIHDVGGFSLWCGQVQPSKGLSVVSNRTESPEGLRKIGMQQSETHGLSNSHFGDQTWPKVVQGEQLLRDAVKDSLQHEDDENALIERLFEILAVDTLPRPTPGIKWDVYVRQMRNSIFIPPVGGDPVSSRSGDAVASGHGASDNGSVSVGSGVYGTQKQTVILISEAGRATFVERSLYCSPEKRQRIFRFQVEEWT